MLHQRNIVETLLIISAAFTLLLISLHYLTNISPITGIWLPLYIITIFILSLCASFRAIQKLLQLNKPIKYDLENILNGRLKFLKCLLPDMNFYPKIRIVVDKEYDTNELSVISTVLERKLVSSWYRPHISEEIGFPFACKEILDQIIGKAFQVSNKIDTASLYTDICSVIVTHLKEYKRAIKLLELSNEGNIETHYRAMHPTSCDKNPSPEHCNNLLRLIMKDLIPWELRDTPHSELLVRILSKKLDSFITNTLSDPNWLNKKLLDILEHKYSTTTADRSDETQVKTENRGSTEQTETGISEKVDETTAKSTAEAILKLPEPVSTNTIESALSDLITQSTAPILQRAIAEQIRDDVNMNSIDNKSENLDVLEPVTDVQSSPILRQRRGRQGKNEVKIYDRIVEGSVKTWESDVDLRCISLGQDLLASLDGEISLSRLWESDNAEASDGWSPNPPPKSPQALWFGEEDTIELDLEGSPPKPQLPNVRPDNPSANFSLPQNIKDLQSTVNQAKNKIGDLQDEAAGMMEGILDFGIAGLKKGLRLTGLHESNQDRSFTTPTRDRPANGRVTPSNKSANGRGTPSNRSANGRGTPVDSFASKQLAVDSGLNHKNSSPNLLHNDLEELNGQVATNAFLVKQHRVTSQDSVPCPIPGKSQEVKTESDSPEPEYEEAEDFASSIAKLRSLLQQRTADTPPKWQDGGVWWEGAEETRGRTHESRHSNRPVDNATLADEYDVSADRCPVPGQTSNNMQRLDKLFQRTVTGVFNSIKTAVGAEGAEEAPPAPPPPPPENWAYVCTSVDLSVGGAVARLVGSRRAYTAVDAAQDSLEHLAPSLPAPADATPPLDLEEWCAGPGCCWGGTAEVAVGVGLWQSHVAHRAATLLIADIAEMAIRAWLSEFTAWLKNEVFVIFENISKCEDDNSTQENIQELDIQSTCRAIMEKIPGPLWLFGEETLNSAVRLSVASFSNKRVNRDLSYRLLDLFALHFTRSTDLRGGSFDIA